MKFSALTLDSHQSHKDNNGASHSACEPQQSRASLLHIPDVVYFAQNASCAWNRRTVGKLCTKSPLESNF